MTIEADFRLSLTLRAQLMESDNVGVTVIGTHFLDLSQISNDGDKGEWAQRRWALKSH